jgi:hypothetical protein
MSNLQLLPFTPQYTPNSNRIKDAILYDVDPVWKSADHLAVVKTVPYLAFHSKDFVIYRGRNKEYTLEFGIDYTFGMYWSKASIAAQSPVYCAIVMDTRDVITETGNIIPLHRDTTLVAEYNAIGGPTLRPSDMKLKNIFSGITAHRAYTQWADDYMPSRMYSNKAEIPLFV